MGISGKRKIENSAFDSEARFALMGKTRERGLGPWDVTLPIALLRRQFSASTGKGDPCSNFG